MYAIVRKGISRFDVEKTWICIILCYLCFSAIQRSESQQTSNIKLPKKEETEYTLHGEIRSVNHFQQFGAFIYGTKLSRKHFFVVWVFLIATQPNKNRSTPNTIHLITIFWGIAPHQVVASLYGLCCLKERARTKIHEKIVALALFVGFLRGGGVQGEGVFLGKPKDSGREDWGTLGKIWGITTPP